MRSARGQEAIDFIFLPLIFMPTVTGWDESSLWMPVSHRSFQDASWCFCWGEHRDFLWEVSPWGPITTSGTISVLRHERGGSRGGALKACNCKNPKAKQWKTGWINGESSWKKTAHRGTANLFETGLKRSVTESSSMWVRPEGKTGIPCEVRRGHSTGVPLPASWDYNVDKRSQLAVLEAKSLPSQRLEQSWGHWARCRAESGVPRWWQGRAGARQGRGRCCRPASICPTTLLKR